MLQNFHTISHLNFNIKWAELQKIYAFFIPAKSIFTQEITIFPKRAASMRVGARAFFRQACESRAPFLTGLVKPGQPDYNVFSEIDRLD